jgi:hypothetical protein
LKSSAARRCVCPHIFADIFEATAEVSRSVMKDVAKKIALSVGAPVVIIYLLVIESVLTTKKFLKPARVHPIGF